MKKAFLTSLFVFALAVISPRLAIGEDGPKITGTISKFRTICSKEFNRINLAGNDKLFAAITISYQVRNDTNKVLLFSKNLNLFKSEIFDWHGVSDMNEKSGVIEPLSFYMAYSKRFLSDYEIRQRLSRGLNNKGYLRSLSSSNVEQLIPNEFRTVESGKYFEYVDTLYLRPLTENSTETDKLSEVCKETDPSKRVMPTLKELGFADGKFKVRYSFSAKDHKEYSTALSDLQERLEPFGHLPLSPAGDIVYTSEYIILAP